MNIMSVSFNSQAELEDFLNRVKGKDDDGEKDFSLQSVVPMPESLQIVSPCDRMLAWAAVISGKRKKGYLQRNFSPAQEGKTYCIRYGWCLQGSCGSSLQTGTCER